MYVCMYVCMEGCRNEKPKKYKKVYSITTFKDYLYVYMYVRVVFLSQGGPHLGLPVVEVLFQVGVIITLTIFEDPGCTQLLQLPIGQLAHAVEVFVLLVAQSEHRVAQARQGGWLVLVGDELEERHGVVCRLALAVGGHEKHRNMLTAYGGQTLRREAFQVDHFDIKACYRLVED